MQAVSADSDGQITTIKGGEPVKNLTARDLMHPIAQSAWECADPGMQFDTTINRWHTSSNTGRINASNPCCFTGDTLVETDDGPVRLDLLYKESGAGHSRPMVWSVDAGSDEATLCLPMSLRKAGDT